MAPHICLVDDDEKIIDMLVFRLAHYKYKVQGFLNPLEFTDNYSLKKINGKHDLVITDINMPGMNGLEFAKKLIKSGFYPENIAMMSGACTPDDWLFASLIGIEKIFHKPFEINEIVSWIETHQSQPFG